MMVCLLLQMAVGGVLDNNYCYRVCYQHRIEMTRVCAPRMTTGTDLGIGTDQHQSLYSSSLPGMSLKVGRSAQWETSKTVGCPP